MSLFRRYVFSEADGFMFLRQEVTITVIQHKGKTHKVLTFTLQRIHESVQDETIRQFLGEYQQGALNEGYVVSFGRWSLVGNESGLATPDTVFVPVKLVKL